MEEGIDGMDRKELAELLLTYLYDCAENLGHSFFFFKLNDFAAKIGISDNAEVTEAAVMLEDAGLVMLTYDAAGEVSAMINNDGCVVVEAGGATGVIPRYREDPGFFVAGMSGGGGEKGDDAGHLVLGHQIQGVLFDIEDAVRADNSLSDEEKLGILREIEVVTIQLGTAIKDIGTIVALLERVGRVESVRALTVEAIGLVKRYVS